MKPFNDYIIKTHPDPDSLFGKNTEEVWDEICKLVEFYTKEYENGINKLITKWQKIHTEMHEDYVITGIESVRNPLFAHMARSGIKNILDFIEDLELIRSNGISNNETEIFTHHEEFIGEIDIVECCKIGPITKESYCPNCGKRIVRNDC